MVRKLVQITLILTVLFGLFACTTSSTEPQESSEVENSDAVYTGKKVLFIDSYHQGYEWSDNIQKGIRSVLDGSGVELEIIHMDTKRNMDDEFRNNAAADVNALVEDFEPDVVIAADDNAQKYFVVPYLKDTETPVVFCGVNWDASIYGYPTDNITGMIEVELPLQLVAQLATFAEGDRVGYLTVDATTERKIVDTYNERFFDGKLSTYYVTTYEEFKAKFIEVQDEVDILFVANNAGIDQWNHSEVEQFILENTKIPTGTINPWMAPYTLIALAKSPEEQGEWSAQTALDILDGTPVSEIPVVENKREVLILNLDIADTLDIVFPPSLLKNAEIYEPQDGS